MLYNNFTERKITQNNAKNTKLLTLLTNRQRARSVPNIKNDWPGILNPNFATNVKFNTTTSYSNDGILRKSNSQHMTCKLSLIPITPVTISGGLQLKPDFSNKLVFKQQSTSRQSGRFTSSKESKKKNKVPIIRIQENQDPLSKSNIFRNTTINNKVNEIIDRQSFYTTRANVKANINKIINERTFVNPINFNNTQRKFQSIGNDKKEKINANNFKVDFFAFGYIEKIIDNPELWGKYVHKMKNNKKKLDQFRQLDLIGHQK